VENGEKLYEGLKGVVGVLLHKKREGTEIAYNQFPLVFEDPAKVETIQRKLWNAGIETTRQYLKPLHHHFDLGYREKEFPVAQKVSQGLLLFPTHYGVSAKDIEMGIDIIRNELE
jgi:dTDP-4-amino-4,6-dideoxygalactose transaminase